MEGLKMKKSRIGNTIKLLRASEGYGYEQDDEINAVRAAQNRITVEEGEGWLDMPVIAQISKIQKEIGRVKT